MTPAARLAAAIDIMALIIKERRPVGDIIKDWGIAHRFAGSGDRAALTTLVHDGLRRKASSSFIMDDDTPRAIMLGSLRLVRGLDREAISALCTGLKYAPEALSEKEEARLILSDDALLLTNAPLDVQGDFPQWLSAEFLRNFGEATALETSSLAERAPVDIRVNTLKGTRESALKSLAHFGFAPTPYASTGLRVSLPQDGRNPALRHEEVYLNGHIEIQDEGSQLAALLTNASPGEQVLDLCAGAGGKSLALAAMLQNQGQIYASDNDARRLAPMFERVARAGARNIQIRAPRAKPDTPMLEASRAVLADLEQACDLVVIDAPCTGTGAWRRNPDAKWRMRPGALDIRMQEQAGVLEEGARYVKKGGRLVYITCSLLRCENEDQIAKFLETHSDFLPLEAGHVCAKAGLPELAIFASKYGAGLVLSPYRTNTDGFYIASLLRA